MKARHPASTTKSVAVTHQDGTGIKKDSREYFEALGKHIDTLRKAKGLTQAELALAIGVSQQAVFAYIIGERRTSVLISGRMARLFGIRLDDLAGMATPPRRNICSRAAWHGQRLQGFPEPSNASS